MQGSQGKKRKSALLTALIVAASFIVIAVCGGLASLGMLVDPSFGGSNVTGAFNTSARGDNDRVTMLDLMARYPIDYVVGPVDVKDTNGDGKIDRNDLNEDGRYTYRPGNYEKDVFGNKVLDTCTSASRCTHQKDADGYKLTNNIYGIPADRYFDVESYIYTTGEKDSPEGRTLYGWKSGIQGSVHLAGMTGKEASRKKLAENGEKLLDNEKLSTTPKEIGIYVTYSSGIHQNGMSDVGSTEKYAIIVPSDVTKVGRGSGGFAVEQTVIGEDESQTTKTVLYYADSKDSTKSELNEYNKEDAQAKGYAPCTDFACFITDRSGSDDKLNLSTNQYYWQPRERLAGVFFPEDSRLKELQGAWSEDVYDCVDQNNRTRPNTRGKAAFQRCDNMRFFVLPDGVETIGDYALQRCEQLVDTNIPTSVTSIGTMAYKKCDGLMHLSIPAGLTINNDQHVFLECNFKHVDNGEKNEFGQYGASSLFPNANSTLFVMGNRPQVGFSDAGTFLFEKRDNALSALSLVGATGENDKMVFVFPNIEDFNDDADNMRRGVVGYDYIDCSGNKVKNSLAGILGTGENKIKNYDIAANFAKNTWCRNVIMPAAITTIGASAFESSHVVYLETYATNIGSNAFNESNTSTTLGTQWFYIHQVKNSEGEYTDKYEVSTSAFTAPSEGSKRHIVYEDYALYTKFSGKKPNWMPDVSNTDNTSNYDIHYQIPIIANVYNEDSEAIRFKAGEMNEYFFNDSDYVEDPVIESGTNAVVYTKKLSNYGFKFTKEMTGGWTDDIGSVSTPDKPTLGNMSSTVWYDSDNYTDIVNSVSSCYNDHSTEPINIYARNVARPVNIENGKYDGTYSGKYKFGKSYMFGTNEKVLGDAASESIDFYTVLGLSNVDYSVTLTSFIYAGTTSAVNEDQKPVVLQNAGSYSFSIQMDPRWGEWSDEYIKDNRDYFTAAAIVERKVIDFSSIDKIPQFVNAAGEDYALYGDRTPLYKYNDGWYVAQKEGETHNDTQIVTNSYLYNTGNDITIKLKGETVDLEDSSISMLGDVRITSRNGLTFANSNNYTASFVFEVKYIPGTNNQYSNYIFDYGNDVNSLDNVTDAERGLRISNKQNTNFRLTKQWFIVVQTNMFVEHGSSDTAYIPVDASDIHYTDDITVNKPALLYGNSFGKIDFEIDYTPVNGKTVSIKERSETASDGMGFVFDESAPENTLEYYFNSSMPVGTYTLRLYGSAVRFNVSDNGVEVAAKGDDTDTVYPAISGEYTIVVLPKEFDEETIAAIHAVMRGSEVTTPSDAEKELDKYINAYPLINKKLHDEINTDELIGELNSELSADRNNGASNYWSDKDGYYDTVVTVEYNREGSGNTIYMSEQAMLGSLATEGTYTFYYKISAKNYSSVGGADAPDRQERGFRTTLYVAMPLTDIYNRIIDVNDPYFKNVTYTGAQVHPLVPTNQYYKYSFDDKDADGKENYINVREKASITLTLYNSDTSRWMKNLPVSDDVLADYFAISADGRSLTVYFDIMPADNGWNVMPQMPSWTFNGFNADVNAITAGLKFASTVKYALIPKTDAVDPDAVDEWGIEKDGERVGGVDDTTGVVFFTVGNGGKADAATAAMLNAIKPATYYLKFFVSEVYAAPNSNTVNVNAYNDIARDNGAPIANVTVGKAINSWTSTPNVMHWTFGDYDPDTHTITAEALYPELLPKDENGEDIADFKYTDGTEEPADVKFVIYKGSENIAEFSPSDDVSATLEGLHAGTYVLATSMGGTDYYTAIAETRLNFVVGRAVNTWTTTPQVVQWTWGNYSAEVNVISAEAKFNGGDGTEANADKPIKFTILHVDNGVRVPVSDELDSFTIEDDGTFSDQATAAAFAALHAGNYFLRASKQGNNDYTDIIGGVTTDIAFTVAQAANTWVTSPGMTSWRYRAFVANNFRAGEPKYENGVITYTLARKNGGSFYFGESSVTSVVLTFNEDGTLDDDMVSAFTALHVDDYTIVVEQAETTDFGPIDYTVDFSVIETVNSWETAPGIIGWTHGAFDSSYVTAGVPTFKESKDESGNAVSVRYKLTKTDDADFTPVTFTSLEGFDFAGLDAGNYVIVASYEGTSDYDKLTSENLNFTVDKYDNDWNPAPVLRGWKYKNFTSTLFIVGTPIRQDNAAAVVSYVIKGDKLSSDITLTFKDNGELSDSSIADLTDLAVGSYTLIATYPGTANYDKITKEITFDVTKIDNSWATRPSVRGWTYGAFDRSNITAGVPTFKESKDESGNAASVRYKLTKTDDADFTPVTFTSLEGFDFAGLDAGDYTLNVSYAGTDDYDFLDTDVDFQVAKVNNSWSKQPVITGFIYNKFNADNNFIAGVPNYPLSDKTVYYVIGTSSFDGVETLEDFLAADYAGEGGKRFVLTNTTALADDIVDYFNDLGSKTYYFAVFVPSADNYTHLFYPGSFNVSQTSNNWKDGVSPDISGWTYGEFNESLFTDGEAEHGSVTYTVRKVVNGAVDESADGIVNIGEVSLADKTYAELKAMLNGLNAGTYSLQASSGTTDEYSEVKSAKQFVVASADNEWDEDGAPSISGWTYDGTTSAAGNKGAAKYENAVITEKFYLTTTDSNGTVVADLTKEVTTSVVAAGSYAYVLTVEDTTNYTGFETTLFFTVEQANNGWETSPAGSYRWTWGDDLTSQAANIVNAAAKNGTVAYSIVRTGGNYTMDPSLTISQLLEQLPVGEYTITVSVTPDGNYKTVAPAVAYVTVVAAQLTVTDPVCGGWTWGVADEYKIFNDVTVTTAKDSDVAKVEYRVSTDGESWTDPFTTYDGLLGYLQNSERAAGNYRVRVSVTCDNHGPEQRTVSFTIAKATIVWSGEQKDATWEWNNKWKESDGGRDIPEWSAVDCKQDPVTLTYTVNGATKSDFDEVKSYLQDATLPAGDYIVRVIAELANHETAEKSFKVTVKVAVNAWTDDLRDSYNIEYKAWENDGWSDLPAPTSKFGTIVCRYGNTSIDINEWIKTLSASSEPYVITLTVAAGDNQYTGLEREISITIVGIGSEWRNIDELLDVEGASSTASVYNYTYYTGVFDAVKDEVVFPQANPTAGTITYSVYVNDSETPAKTYNVLTELAAYFTSDLTAGTYKIIANYQPTDDSYAPLHYAVTIIVARARVEWSQQLEQSYSKTYNNIDLPDPAADKDFAVVTVTVKKSGSNDPLDMGGKKLSEFASTLHAGTYTITATIEDSSNYFVQGAKEITSMLYVGAIQNAWNDVTENGKTITAAEWTDGYTWTFTRGEEISVALPDSVIGELSITLNGTPTSIKTLAELNKVLNDNYSADGRYPLRFSVAATDDYNGLVSNCAVVIDKKSNTWTQTLVSYTGSGSVDTSEFTMPAAEVGSTTEGGAIDLRLFNIVKTGDPENSEWYTTALFMTELAQKVNGTYTITVRIGGSIPKDALSAFEKALEDYNADYETITCSCYVTLSPAENAWVTKLSDKSWTYGDNVSMELVEADYGSDRIIYTISGNNGEWTVNTSDYNRDELALNALNYIINKLIPGTYNITAIITPTDLYAAPTESNFAMFTVAKYVATWNTTEDLEEKYSVLHAAYQTVPGGFLPALTVKYISSNKDELMSGTSAVSWKIGNETLEESVISALNKLDARTYIVTATYPGDAYNASISFTATVVIDQVQTAWDTTTAALIADAANLSWTYGSVPDKNLPATLTSNWAEANSNIEYTYTTKGNTIKITDWSKFIEDLDTLGYGNYRVNASIDGDNNHTPLTATFIIDVDKVETAWVNGDTLGDSTAISWQYGKKPASIKLPDMAIANWAEGEIVYKVTIDGNTSTITDDDWNAYLARNPKLAVGTYTFTASVDGGNNHTDKVFTAVVTVEKATVAWTKDTDDAVKQHSWVLKGSTNSALTQPALEDAGDCTVTYTLVKVGGTGTLYSGSVWSNESPKGLLEVLADQKAGAYEITAKVIGANDSYNLPADVTYTVTISAQPNSWKTKPAATVTWIYRGDSNTAIVFEPEFNKESLQLTVGGETVTPAQLGDKLGSLGFGSYSIVASVPANDDYAALDALTVTLVIERASDSFGSYNVPASWNWDDVSQKTDSNGVAWQTTWNTTLSVPVPTVSTTATAIVYNNGVEEFAATLHYDSASGVKKVIDTDLNALKSKLMGLHVGSYTIEFVVTDSTNYNGCTVSAAFEVKKVDNAWDGNEGAPKIAGWQYDSSVANPTATPMYGKGTVKFSYAKAGDETIDDLKNGTVTLEWQDSTETAEGSYWLRAEVPGTDDYKYLVDYFKFSIRAGQNGWVNNPGVIAWDWNGYDKTINLFSGSAKNNGTATFKIFAGTSGNNRNLKMSDFAFNGATPDKTDEWVINFFGTNGFTLIRQGNVMVVSDEVEEWLNALKPGTYLLSVKIAADNNYDALDGTATFIVRAASNSWVSGKSPAVSSFVYNGTVNFTKGETVYGDAGAVTYKLEGTTLENAVQFVSDDAKTAYEKVQDYLTTLGAGTYTLSAWVAADANGTYSALYSAASPYTSRSFTVSRATNAWANTPAQQVSKAYSVINATTFDTNAFKAMYPELVPTSGTDTVSYALLDAADYHTRKADMTYSDLFAEIKKLPAGEYIIRAAVALTDTDNYYAIGATDTKLTISSHENAFTQIPDALSAQWARGEDMANATVLTDFEIKAKYGENTVTYTLKASEDTVTYDTYSAFKAAVATLNAKSYNVTIAIAATDDYAGLSVVRMLTVSPGENVWKNGWVADGSIKVVGAAAKASASWVYGSSVEWTRAIPQYGDIVYVEIRLKGASSALQYVTIDYSKGNGDSAVQEVNKALSALPFGTYEIVASAPADVNWAALSNTVEFSVTKATNEWKTSPRIDGADNNKWVYTDSVTTAPKPYAEAKFGRVQYEYYTESGNSLSSMPTAAGEYVIKFVVEGTDDYDGLERSLAVTIEKANNRALEPALGVTGWTWGTYDRETNIFTGTPEIASFENVTVTFSVGLGSGESFTAIKDLANITLVNGLVEKGSKAEAALKALTGGVSEQSNFTRYTLRIHVETGETSNYNSFTSETGFNVTGATNGWVNSPYIVSWEANNWNDIFPSATSRYGYPEITIKAQTGDTVYFHGKYRLSDDGDELILVPDINILNTAAPGMYDMITRVDSSIGEYNNVLVSTFPFRVTVRGEGQKNTWDEMPGINGWTANIDEIYNLPTGKPLRGLPKFEFYVRNDDGSRGMLIDAILIDDELQSVLLPKGNSYEADIYLPISPGNYIMVASSMGNPTEAGTSDALDEYEYPLNIGYRSLGFENELRIETLLYLGDRANWAGPTATPTVGDAIISYVYTNKETGETSTDMPRTPGKYTVTATLSATYCVEKSMSVDFTVELTPNSWVSAPNIKDWSEENKPNDPVGSATVGSDQIEYTYWLVGSSDKPTTDKPTTEGTYIMYADLIVPGYEPLHAEYRFTIEPAFDRDLVVVDIILGLVACAMAVVVIIFAIRRYREN